MIERKLHRKASKNLNRKMGLTSTDNMIIENNDDPRVPPIAPFHTSLPDGRDVIIKSMTDIQLSETFTMIQEAAQQSNGFGIDEYTNENEFREDIKGGYCFAVTIADSNELIASFILAISKFYRGSTVADPFIIVKSTERRKGIGEFCLQNAVDFASDLGFIGMYIDCFSNNKGMLKIIENTGGFARVGCLPLGGQMKNGTIVGSVIFYRDLRREE
ncbi:hypothetical protein LOTGIDRAFT_237686 [Lottia gigantea]|uniref:N-acetyltransferase domain-containing protein n=1 Tax=Lottia gigantea TaxID=225164 RepID=V4AH80_LOTGI|nr:hypothetical protein LOTGIDRAFT_237686 [Lottia gigantea]ESP03374.1 hypothetical protein LOTGIDRAFT_237686 [Lottia gigantea]